MRHGTRLSAQVPGCCIGMQHHLLHKRARVMALILRHVEAQYPHVKSMAASGSDGKISHRSVISIPGSSHNLPYPLSSCRRPAMPRLRRLQGDAAQLRKTFSAKNGWVGRTARCPQFAGPFPYGPPPNRTCQLSRHPALW